MPTEVELERAREYAKEYYQKNKERIAEKQKARRDADPTYTERTREYAREYRERDGHKDMLNEQCRTRRQRAMKDPVKREVYNARMRDYRHKDIEKTREYSREYYAANSDRLSTYQKEIRESKPGVHAASSRKYNMKNPEKIRMAKGMKFRPGQTVQGMKDAQDHKCLICKQPLPSGRRAHVDHCHKTGWVRGVLCGNHNKLLGLAGDNPAILRSAIEYLEFFSALNEKETETDAAPDHGRNVDSRGSTKEERGQESERDQSSAG